MQPCHITELRCSETLKDWNPQGRTSFPKMMLALIFAAFALAVRNVAQDSVVILASENAFNFDMSCPDLSEEECARAL